MQKHRDLTDGPILKRLLLFSLPMMAGNMLQQIYNIADTLIVGRVLGASALAAVGSAYTLMIFLTSLIMGLCMGSGALFSSRFGAKQMKEMRHDVWLSFLFIGLVTLVIYAIIFPGTDAILHFMHVPEGAYALMREYVSVIFAGIGFVFLYNFFAYLLRSVGNSMTPLWFLGASSILNIVLDLLFVISFHLGVQGAALATVISQAVSGVGILLYTLKKEKDILPKKEDRHMNVPRLKQIISNDIMTGLQQSVMNFGILMIQGLVNSFGTTIMAAFAAAVKIDTLAYMPAQEFGNAYSLFISQNYGSKKGERIEKGTHLAMLTSVLFCVSVSVLVFFTASKLMGLFVDSSEVQVIAEGVKYLRIEGAAYFGIGILFLLYGYYRGIQRPQMSLVLTIISLGTRVALAYLLAPRTSLGVLAIWWAIPIGWVLADLVGIGYVKGKFRPF